MSKRKVVVTNVGRRVRERLGSRFLPNESQELEVNSRQYLTLKAVKDFVVEIVENDKNTNEEIKQSENDDNNNVENDENEGELDYYDLNIEEVLKAVNEGIFDVDKAIALELAGKNRVTLIEKLEEIKQEE